MKTAYFDCFSGISGDMCLASLLDAGVDLGHLKRELGKLPVRGYEISSERVVRAGISAVGVEVRLKHVRGSDTHKKVRWRDIKNLVEESSLHDGLKKKGLSIFRTLFEAEALVHGSRFDKVHLHELGSADCVVDIFGTLIGLEALGVESVFSSPINLGGGTVVSEHGVLPVPAPATAEILKGVPVYSSGPSFEMTTPTGAVLIRSLSKGYGPMPLLIPEKIGTGAGGRDVEGRPNILRVFIGEMERSAADQTITVIETNIDDMNPQIYEYVFEKLFGEGALDVFMTQIIMKKLRPAVKLSVLCENDMAASMMEIIFRETTSIGLRYYRTSRKIMERDIGEVSTAYGVAKIKKARLGKKFSKSSPEYEDCRKLARKSGEPLVKILGDIRGK